jgi:hypothetical protein
MRVFGQLLLVDKQKVPYLYKITSKEFEFLHKSYATAQAWQLPLLGNNDVSRWRIFWL